MDINGKVALVTGGASGMGQAMCRSLHAKGAKVVVWDINPEKTESLAKELNGFAISCNVANTEEVEAAFSNLVSNFGIPSICVNCAGVVAGERVVGKEGPMPLEHFKKVIDINLIGTFNILRMAASNMAKLPLSGEERGVIINTASIAAFEGQIGQAAYSASKGGVVALTLPVARELAQFQIRVVCIAPGIFETPMMASLPEKARSSLIEASIFPKRLGKAQEFADLALHIISNVMINGTVIRLDGALKLGPK